MTRLSLFNSPLLLGFDHMERVLDQVAKSGNDGFPPYNIEQTDQNSLRITLAVAGFADDDLQVTIEENQLVIRGRRPEENDERIFLHKGIATRQFQRSFVLAEGIEVQDAHMDNGLLHIDLQRPEPARMVRTVSIRRGGNENTTHGVTIEGNKENDND